MNTESMPWYKSPIVWLGIALTVLILAACIHMIIVSAGTDTGPKGQKTKDITHILGMPLTHESTSATTEEEDSNTPSEE